MQLYGFISAAASSVKKKKSLANSCTRRCLAAGVMYRSTASRRTTRARTQMCGNRSHRLKLSLNASAAWAPATVRVCGSMLKWAGLFLAWL